MRRKVGIIALGLIIFSACNKDDSEIATTHTGLLHQVKFGSELWHEYSYNAQGQVVEEKSRMHYTKHNYEDGRLVSSDHYFDPGMFSSVGVIAQAAMNRKEWVTPQNTAKSSTKTYFYDNDAKVTRSVNELNNCEYTYDERNRINRQSFIDENELTGYIEFIYDDNNNLIKRLHYWMLNNEPELQTTTEYEFDNYLNPFKPFSNLIFPGEFTNTNNIVKETYTIHGEIGFGMEKVHVTENKYTYNSLKFPVTKNGTETYIYY